MLLPLGEAQITLIELTHCTKAQAGIWQDAVTTLGELRVHQRQDAALATDWKDLLESVGLSNISTEAIASCCTL